MLLTREKKLQYFSPIYKNQADPCYRLINVCIVLNGKITIIIAHCIARNHILCNRCIRDLFDFDSSDLTLEFVSLLN